MKGPRIMGKLIENHKTKKFDFVDKNGNVIPSVSNLIYPTKMKRMLDVASDSFIELETVENGLTRQFDVLIGNLSSMEGLHKVLLENQYFINYKLVNPLREYLSLKLQAIQTNQLIEYTHKSLGFFKDLDKQWVFLLDKTVTFNGLSEYYDPSFEFKAGSITNYEQFVKDDVLPHKTMQLALVLGLASVPASYLKDYADTQTIVVNMCGPSSTGKSTTAQFIASLWGNPKISNKGMVKTFNMTANALFTEIEGFNGVAIVLDDITTAGGFNKSQLIYQLAQGESRARLHNYGKEVKQGLPFSGLAVITSETPVLSEAETRQGLIARVLDIDDFNWTVDADHSTRIKNHIGVNFGHLGEKFAQAFLKVDDTVIKQQFEEAKASIHEALTNKDNLSYRILNKLAVIYLAANQVKDFLGFDIDLEAIKEMLVSIDQNNVEERHIAVKGFEVVKLFITRHHHQFDKYDEDRVLIHSSKGQLMGIMEYHENTVRVAIPSEHVKEILAGHRIYEYKPVLKFWSEKKLITTQSGRSTINLNRLDSRAVQFVFERTDETILPWYHISTNVQMALGTLLPPTKEVIIDDSQEIDEIFEESQYEN